MPDSTNEEQSKAEQIVSLLTSGKGGQGFHVQVLEMVRECGWYDALARYVPEALLRALKDLGTLLGQPAKEALGQVSKAAKDFVKAHPILVALILIIIAVGLLAVVTWPWLAEAFGFSKLGPTAGIHHHSDAIAFRC